MRRSISGEAWRLLVEVALLQRARLPAIAAEFRLSPVQCHLLRLLEPETPVSMGRLAAGLACDASNVTGLVTRLEARGFLRRQAPGHDRRVKIVVLTRPGAELRARILARMSEPPPGLARLPSDDQRALCRILREALEQIARKG